MNQPTVLIIEDSPHLYESLRDMLELRGYRALIASTGNEGISTALRERPDLILLDIRLPDIDGYQVYSDIRNDTWGAGANIVILTASESIDVIATKINLPLERVLFKPDWSLNALLKKIEVIISTSPQK